MFPAPSQPSIRTFEIPDREGTLARGLPDGFALWRRGAETLQAYNWEGKPNGTKKLGRFLVTRSALSEDLLDSRPLVYEDQTPQTEGVVARLFRVRRLPQSTYDPSYAGSENGPIYLFLRQRDLPATLTDALPTLGEEGSASGGRADVLAALAPGEGKVFMLAKVSRPLPVRAEDWPEPASLLAWNQGKMLAVRTQDRVSLLQVDIKNPSAFSMPVPRPQPSDPLPEKEEAIRAFERACEMAEQARAEAGTICFRWRNGRFEMVAFDEPWTSDNLRKVLWRNPGSEIRGSAGKGAGVDWKRVTQAYRMIADRLGMAKCLSYGFFAIHEDRVLFGENTGELWGWPVWVDYGLRKGPAVKAPRHGRGIVPFYDWPE